MKIAKTCRYALAATVCAAAASSAHGRSLLYYYDFDKVENGALISVVQTKEIFHGGSNNESGI